MNNSFSRLQAQYGDAPRSEAPAQTEQLEQPAAETIGPAAEVSAETVQPQVNPEETQQAAEDTAKTPEMPRIGELIAALKEQTEAIARLNQRIEALDKRSTEMSNTIEAMRRTASAPDDGAKQTAVQMEELKQGFLRQEKANIDILRDSKNFQAVVREQMQRDLDRYHKMHSETANAPLLTEIANIYVMSAKAISYLSDERERRNVGEIVLDGLQEFLEDQGVAIHTTPVGERRSLKTCKTRKTVPTADQEKHGMVAASMNPSFVLGNQVLIKENVDTYIYDEQLAEQLRADEKAQQAQDIQPGEVNAPAEEHSDAPAVTEPCLNAAEVSEETEPAEAAEACGFAEPAEAQAATEPATEAEPASAGAATDAPDAE